MPATEDALERIPLIDINTAKSLYWEYQTVDRAKVLKLLLHLQALIEKHATQVNDPSGHGLCWEHDVELWKAAGVVPPDFKYPHQNIPSEEEFIEIGCRPYYRSRVKEKESCT